MYKNQKLTLDSLPNDIIYNITKHLTVIDIFILKNTNVTLKEKITNLQNDILSLHLRYIMKFNSNYVNHMYNIIEKNVFDKIAKYNTYFKMHKLKFVNYQLKEFIFNFKNLYHFDIAILNNGILDNAFNKILYYYIDNKGILGTYPDKLELLTMYIFLEMYSISNWEYLYNFLKNMGSTHPINDRMYDKRLSVYTDIITTQHIPRFLNVNDIHYISKYVVTVSSLLKVIRFIPLDLSCAKFEVCCATCINDLYLLTNVKKENYTNVIVNYNYAQIKNLFKKHYIHYYNEMNYNESFILNDLIYIKNPITNKRVRINGALYKKMMRSMYNNNKKNYYIIMNNINKQKVFLYQKYFLLF